MPRPTPADPDFARLVGDRLDRLMPRREGLPHPARHSPESPEPTAGRVLPARRLGGRQLGVLVAILVLGLVGGGWALLRARPVALADDGGSGVAIESPRPAASPAGPDASGTAGPAPTGPSPNGTLPPPTAATVVVHVIGAVRHPGLARLPAGSRVDDALRARGGLRADADPGRLNLAQVLTDGQQVLVGRRGHPAGEVRGAETGSGAGGGVGGGSTEQQAVDLNSADQARLETLPGVGPVIAAAILAWRAQHGRFTRVEELQEVDGIGPKTFARLAPHVRV